MNPFPLPSGQITGDTFPFFRDGVCHLFHMLMPGIAHHVSRDLVHWEPRPMAVMPGAAGSPDSSNIATGCVVEHDGRFYLFYTGNQNVCLAVSDDLDHWTRHPANPVVVADDRRYSSKNFRDPFVYFSQTDHCWHMLFGTQVCDVPAQRSGCVGMAKSSDLLHWELAPALWSPRLGPHADCPQLIEHLGRWYLFYLHRNSRYRVASSPSGPFQRPPLRNLGTVLANAGSRPAWDGQRWITIPFLSRLGGEKDFGGWEYGGCLAIPRQLDFHPDGSVTQRPVDSVVRAILAAPAPLNGIMGTGAPANPTVLAGDWKLTPSSAVSENPDGGTLLLPALPADLYFECRVEFDRLDSDFHLLLRADPALLSGYQFSIHPRSGQASLRPISNWDTDRVLESQSIRLGSANAFTVRMFLCGTVFEIFINDQSVLSTRLYGHRLGLLGIECRDARYSIRDIAWRGLDPGY